MPLRIGSGAWYVDPVKPFLSPSSITVPNFVAVWTQKIWGNGARPLWLYGQYASPHRCVILPDTLNFLVSHGTSVHVLGNPPKNGHLASRLSSSLKSSEPTQISRLTLVVHSKYGPVSYRFRDKRRLQSKIANFSQRPR